MTENHQQLSEREEEILKLVATGASNKEIATALTISVNTVKVHLRNIFGKIGVVSRTEAAMWAVREGILPPELEGIEYQKQDLTVEEQRRRPPSLWVVLGGVFFALVILIGVSWFIWQQFFQVATLDEQLVDAKRWQELVDLSIPRSRFAYVTFENQIYSIGGQTDKGITDSVERFDPPTNSWSMITTKPTAVFDVGAVVIGGKIYLPGGRTESGKVISTVEVYDPHQDDWSTVSPLPIPLSAYAITAYEGDIYLFGGWNGEQYIDSVFSYDPDDDIWIEQPTMPTSRGYAGAAIVNEKIYILGGFDGHKALAVNEIFIPGNSENPWDSASSLPQERFGSGVTVVANLIYIIGGSKKATTSFQYDVNEDEWQPFVNLQTQSWQFMGISSLGTNLFVWGGEVGEKTSGKLWSYQVIYTIVLPIIQQ